MTIDDWQMVARRKCVFTDIVLLVWVVGSEWVLIEISLLASPDMIFSNKRLSSLSVKCYILKNHTLNVNSHLVSKLTLLICYIFHLDRLAEA